MGRRLQRAVGAPAAPGEPKFEPADKPKPGAAGTQAFSFRVVGGGGAFLELVYAPPVREGHSARAALGHLHRRRGHWTPERRIPVRLHFYGTKGYVAESSRAHAGHSAFVLEAEGFRLLCDFGQNRKGMLAKIRPDAIFVSHAHPDHAWGLWEGTSLPVYASAVDPRAARRSCRS